MRTDPLFRSGSGTTIMGVVNATPDSFTGDGLLRTGEDIESRISDVMTAGADIIDVGGESTRPGFDPVDVSEELRRALPVVRAAVNAGANVSIDTRKAQVAEAAVRAGAFMINDVSSLSDDAMPGVAAATGVYLVILHNRPIEYAAGVGESLLAGLTAPIERALRAGVRHDRIVVDPGLGFGKTWRDNLAVIRALGTLRTLGFPILVGPSRKGTISVVLGVGRDDRLEGSLALVTICIAQGARIVRVHDVSAMKRAAATIDAVIGPMADA